MRAAVADATEDLGFLRLDKLTFSSSPHVSIDNAVLEKTKAAVVLPIDFEWGDVSSWGRPVGELAAGRHRQCRRG